MSSDDDESFASSVGESSSDEELKQQKRERNKNESIYGIFASDEEEEHRGLGSGKKRHTSSVTSAPVFVKGVDNIEMKAFVERPSLAKRSPGSPIGRPSFTSKNVSFAAFEKHTKGIGLKLLMAQGYQIGQGLGKKRQGIAEPVTVSMRPKGSGLGFGETKEKPREKDKTIEKGKEKPTKTRVIANDLSTIRQRMREQRDFDKINRFTELRHNIRLLMQRDSDAIESVDQSLAYWQQQKSVFEKRLEMSQELQLEKVKQSEEMNALLHLAKKTDHQLTDLNFFIPFLIGNWKREVYTLLFCYLDRYLTKNSILDCHSWFTEYGTVLNQPTLQKNKNIMNAYETLFHRHFLPAFNASSDRSSLLSQWQSVLPEKIRSLIMFNVLNELHTILKEWSWHQNSFGAHVHVLEWLPSLKYRNGDWLALEPKIVSYLKFAISSWEKEITVERLMGILSPWPHLLSHHWWSTVLDHVSVRMNDLLLHHFSVNPADQDLATLQLVFSLYPDYLSLPKLVTLLKDRVFEPWLQVLYEWLSSPDADKSEIVTWYRGWCGGAVIDVKILAHVAIRRQMARALVMMQSHPLPPFSMFILPKLTPIPAATQVSFRENVLSVLSRNDVLCVPVKANVLPLEMQVTVGSIYKCGTAYVHIGQDQISIWQRGQWNLVSVSQLLESSQNHG